MAYDEALADRVSDLISVRADVSERKMFGSFCFLIGGNLAVCVRQDELLVRLEPEDAERVLAEDGVRIAPIAGRRMRGWVLVSADVVADADALAEWVDTGAAYAASLPPK
jgi:TfoX/Sxy family transcriptional regulator of competence genes